MAIFCHFDRRGEVREHVLHYVSGLGRAGFEIVFVTNSGRLRPDAQERLRALCAAILVRRNIGYDFGGWREALDRLALPLADAEMLVLANDSVYGPLGPMDDMLARIDFAEADVWGLTDSWQSRYHLQSFFLAIGPRVLGDPAWCAFWRTVRPVPSKHWVIDKYEVGFTQAMLRAGFRCKAVWPYSDLAARIDPRHLIDAREGKDAFTADPMLEIRRSHTRRIREAASRRVPLNPTSDLWRQLLLAGFPFIKRELLRDNPTRVADVADWRMVAAEALKPIPASSSSIFSGHYATRRRKGPSLRVCRVRPVCIAARRACNSAVHRRM